MIRAMNLVRWWQCIAGCLLVLAVSAQAGTMFQDPLDTPAKMREKITGRPLMAVAHAGDQLVAVGSRGLIAVSGDQGKTWTQSKVPVQSDLLAVQFPTASEGWAVGHDGVVLHSTDGGKTWSKQLDGRAAGPAFKAFYKSGAGGKENMGEAAVTSISDAVYGKAATGPRIPGLLEQNYKSGPALPFIDVWFEDTQRGFVVGAFGMIAATTDGGKTWEPWLHRIDNSSSNLNAIRGIGGEVYIAGEQGRIFRLDRNRGFFTKMETGYIGSLFGITGNGESLIAYGLRGTAYRATLGGKPGSEKWEVVAMPNEHTLSAGIALADGSGFVLVNAAGELLIGDKAAKNFSALPAQKAMRMTGIAELKANRGFVVTGIEGVRTVPPRNAAAGH